MSATATEYYQPVNVFRQPALIVKKRSQKSGQCHKPNSISIDVSSHHRKTWKNDVSKIGSPLLRKASDDFNDYYTTKKLKSEYWKLSRETSAASLPTDLSIVDDMILISNMDAKNNLKLINVKPSEAQRSGEATKLHEIQTVSVPGTPITSCCLLPASKFNADYFEGHDQLLLCGHQDGVVNLISTSMEAGDAKIAKRYKHGKFLEHEKMESSNLDKWLQPFPSLPVRKLQPWSDTSYISLINDSLFIYDLNRAKKPQYLQSFPGLEAMAVNSFNNPYLLSLCGSQFGNSGIALLDLRSNGMNGNLYIPECNDGSTSSHSRPTKSRSYHDCTWIDEYHLANCVNETVKIWDIRATSGEAQCEIFPMKGCIESLNYNEDSKNLYTNDDQGNIISWDLTRLNNMKKATLAQGFNSILFQDTQELLHEVSQCGNIIVNGASHHKQFSKNSVRGSTFMDTIADGSLITLDAQELGLHKIYDVKCRAALSETCNEATKTTPSIPTYEENSQLQEDSDVTLMMADSSSSSSHSDCFSSNTLHSVESHEIVNIGKDLGHQPKTDSLYSLKNYVLSGSTVYQEII